MMIIMKMIMWKKIILKEMTWRLKKKCKRTMVNIIIIMMVINMNNNIYNNKLIITIIYMNNFIKHHQ